MVGALHVVVETLRPTIDPDKFDLSPLEVAVKVTLLPLAKPDEYAAHLRDFK